MAVSSVRTQLRWLLALAILGAARGARGDGPVSVALRYEVDPGVRACPSEAEFRQGVERRLGYDPFDPFDPTAGLQLTTRIRARPGKLEGELAWRHGESAGEVGRRFSAAEQDCAGLVHAMQFAVAVELGLMVGQGGGEAHERPAVADGPNATAPAGSAAALPPGPPAPSASPPLPKPPERIPPLASTPAAPLEASPRRAVWGVVLGVGAEAEWGSLPGVALNGRVLAEIRREALGLGIGAEASLPAHWNRGDGTGFDAHAFGATIAPCAYVGSGTWRVCGVGGVGRLYATGFGVDAPESSSGWFVQTGLRAGFTMKLARRVWSTVYVDVLGTLKRWSLALNGLNAWTTPPVSIALGFDVATPFQ